MYMPRSFQNADQGQFGHLHIYMHTTLYVYYASISSFKKKCMPFDLEIPKGEKIRPVCQVVLLRVSSFSLSCIGEGNGNPLQRSCLENPRDGGAW